MSEGPTREGALVEAALPLRTAIPGNSVSSLNDPESLRVRAKETRAMAERETDVAVKLTMLTIAGSVNSWPNAPKTRGWARCRTRIERGPRKPPSCRLSKSLTLNVAERCVSFLKAV